MQREPEPDVDRGPLPLRYVLGSPVGESWWERHRGKLSAALGWCTSVVIVVAGLGVVWQLLFHEAQAGDPIVGLPVPRAEATAVAGSGDPTVLLSGLSEVLRSIDAKDPEGGSGSGSSGSGSPARVTSLPDDTTPDSSAPEDTVPDTSGSSNSGSGSGNSGSGSGNSGSGSGHSGSGSGHSGSGSSGSDD